MESADSRLVFRGAMQDLVQYKRILFVAINARNSIQHQWNYHTVTSIPCATRTISDMCRTTDTTLADPLRYNIRWYQAILTVVHQQIVCIRSLTYFMWMTLSFMPLVKGNYTKPWWWCRCTRLLLVWSSDKFALVHLKKGRCENYDNYASRWKHPTSSGCKGEVCLTCCGIKSQTRGTDR